MSVHHLTASYQLDRADKPTQVRVSVPKGIPLEKFLQLNRVIVDKIIKTHTGCSCLSGTINVLFESSWEAPMQVDLG